MQQKYAEIKGDKIRKTRKGMQREENIQLCLLPSFLLSNDHLIFFPPSSLDPF